MAEMEATILDLFMVSSKIVSSSADFLRIFFVPFFLVGENPLLGRRAIDIAIICIASSADIFPVSFEQITETFFFRLCAMK